ncbi:MAG: hypothetical protein ABIR62_04995 [Dokdonella sp.]|uniref:hypothetical protein n=1 Tax=Dokdonella sp. TaxID=2291710 RepID=UPI0032649F24
MKTFGIAMTNASSVCGLCMLAATWVASASASQTDIPAPAGSGAFGRAVVVLASGNIVVTDPEFGAGATPNIGAVYLFDRTGLLISVLTGSHANDHVGSDGVTVLANGHFVASSSRWLNSTG